MAKADATKAKAQVNARASDPAVFALNLPCLSGRRPQGSVTPMQLSER
jgi:hypothetical protein